MAAGPEEGPRLPALYVGPLPLWRRVAIVSAICRYAAS